MFAVNLENPKYESHLKDISSSLTEIATVIFDAHTLAYEGFQNKNIESLSSVKNILKGIESEANRIDNEIIKVFALFDPGAADLRRLISFLKITNELVRIAENARSYAKNIKEAINTDMKLDVYDEYVLQLHKSAISSIKYALTSLDSCDLEYEDFYIRAKIEESKTDDLCSLLEKEIISRAKESGELSFSFVKILNTFRKLEKSADHAVNITNLMIFAKRGGKIKCHKRG